MGWIGTRGNLKYLENLLEVLKKIEKNFPNVRFLVVCDQSSSLLEKQLKGYHFIRWSKEKEVANFHKIDIGLMPLADDEWTRGKCGFKLLQYMSCGIASVASPVGVNKTIVQDGVNGFLAKNDEEWFLKLSQLIQDEKLREKMGKKARQTIIKKYSTAKNFQKLKKVIDTLN